MQITHQSIVLVLKELIANYLIDLLLHMKITSQSSTFHSLLFLLLRSRKEIKTLSSSHEVMSYLSYLPKLFLL